MEIDDACTDYYSVRSSHHCLPAAVNLSVPVGAAKENDEVADSAVNPLDIKNESAVNPLDIEKE